MAGHTSWLWVTLRLVWRLVWRQPGLLVEHLGAHGTLLAAELALWLQAQERRLWLTLLSCLLLACGVVLAGMAAMLSAFWWLMPGRWPVEAGLSLGMPLPVLLWLLAVPLLPLLAAGLAWQAARRQASRPAFDTIGAQLAADVAAWREAVDAAGAQP
ncbi:hypothetical protein [Sphaerotilus mobilis]|uniref:Uncharacterized protein n=1 Tax=Sphaerotilus mobilis TaxID=47994 RepID=A0A4Q7LAU2_9BURK|nr:hypothetical protein [Sphaerotilus mobilis]RZS46750.1 hypothetical protein EV685_4007 [Sphaerotilus mobilis]